MKIAIASLAAAAAAVLVAAGAGANGSPYSPGLMYGWNGVGAKDGVRFVAFGMPKATILAAVRARDGHVLQTKVVRGFYGVPLVAYDGTAGGLSGDRKSLVLATYGPFPGRAGKTRFAVVNTSTLRLRSRVELPGSWSYDAISPDGSTLYLVEHMSPPPNAQYRVRIFDLAAGRLLAGAIVDRLEKEEVMGGEPVTRATDTSGRWAYTLYARQKGHPFVHALDTERRQAYCIDLPLKLGQGKQMELRLRLDGQKLVVRDIRTSLAVINTRTWAVKRT
jgi:hypothetical protein